MLPVCWPASSLLPALGRPRLFWNRIQLLPPSLGGGAPQPGSVQCEPANSRTSGGREQGKQRGAEQACKGGEPSASGSGLPLKHGNRGPRCPVQLPGFTL